MGKFSVANPTESFSVVRNGKSERKRRKKKGTGCGAAAARLPPKSRKFLKPNPNPQPKTMKTALILMMLIVNSYPGRVVKDTYVRLPNGNPTEQELYTAIAAAWGEKAEWVGKNHAGLHHLEVLTPEGELIELSFTRLPNRDEWEKRAGYVMMGTARVGEESYYFQAVVAIQIPDVKVFIYE